MVYSIFNGKLVKADEVAVSPQDRGFRYGDGVFDTLLVKNGKIYQLAWHIERLRGGLNATRIKFDIGSLEGLIQLLLKANNFIDGLLRVQITRGVGGRGYLPEKTISPTILIETIEKPEISDKAITLWQSSYKKISNSALPVNFKLCQGLNSTLARMEAMENNCFDAVLVNEKNEICETSSANIFWFKDNVLYTPALSCGVLEGSIRAAIIRLTPYKLCEVAQDIESLRGADAVFITNTAWKILAVDELKSLGMKWQSEELVKQFLALLNDDIDNS